MSGAPSSSVSLHCLEATWAFITSWRWWELSPSLSDRWFTHGVGGGRGGRGPPLLFLSFCLFLFLAFGISSTGKLNIWDSAFYWMDRVGLFFFPPIFLHFALAFPERKAFVDKRRWGFPLLYLPSLLLIYLMLLGKLFFFAQVPWGDEFFVRTNELLDRLLPFYIAVMSLAAFAGFVDSYLKARTVTVKKQTKWIVWGTGFGTAPFALCYAVPYLIGVQPTLALELSVVPLAVIPLSFAYAIVKYRLMDVEVLFKRGVA